ncbi:MAG: hypothetical protein JWN16_2383 [Alphaproteobacteria bacterium]|nr:hypothetical protein [Alphaproteobacteria bacterium]
MKRLLAVLLLLPAIASAAETTCKKSPALTGQCRIVKGSLGLTSNIGVTLVAEDGTRFIIKAPPDSNADIALPVMQNWLYWQSKTGSMKTRINGSFEVCPLPTEINTPGIKDFGCITKGTRITEDKSAPAGN